MMKQLLRRSAVGLTAALAVAGCHRAPDASAQMLIKGAGATFPNIIYQKWCNEYTKLEPTVQSN